VHGIVYRFALVSQMLRRERETVNNNGEAPCTSPFPNF
jgi:hypothetical protein